MQTNSLFDAFKSENAHFTLEVDRCMKQLTNIQLEIDSLEILTEIESSRESPQKAANAETYIKLDQLHNMKHKLCVRAYNY